MMKSVWIRAVVLIITVSYAQGTDTQTYEISERKNFYRVKNRLTEAEKNISQLQTDVANLQSNLDDFKDTTGATLKEHRGMIDELEKKVVSKEKTEECGCPHGFTLQFKESCYHISRDKQNYNMASVICQNIGGELAAITSKEEDDFIRNYLLRHKSRGDGFIIMANDFAEEGKWYSGGRQVATYTNWGPGEPNNSGGTEHCADLLGYHGFKWNDSSCSYQKNFICEAKRCI